MLAHKVPVSGTPTTTHFDDFNREVDPGWGTAPTGYVWTTTGETWVNGSSGLLPLDSEFALSESKASLAEAGPWDGDFDLLVKFLFLTVPSGSSPTSTYQISLADTAGAASVVVAINPSATSGEVTVWSGVGPPVIGTNAQRASLTWAGNTWYWLRLEHRRGSTGTDRVRVWPDGSAEPTTWDVTMSIFAGSLSGPLFALADIALDAHGSERWYFDLIDFDYVGAGLLAHLPIPALINQGLGASNLLAHKAVVEVVV